MRHRFPPASPISRSKHAELQEIDAAVLELLPASKKELEMVLNLGYHQVDFAIQRLMRAGKIEPETVTRIIRKQAVQVRTGRYQAVVR